MLTSDLERLKAAWPLDWKKSEGDGWEVFFGCDKLYAYVDGEWHFWFSPGHAVDDTLLGRGGLRYAAALAAVYLRELADEMQTRADDVGYAAACAPGRGVDD